MGGTHAGPLLPDMGTCLAAVETAYSVAASVHMLRRVARGRKKRVPFGGAVVCMGSDAIGPHALQQKGTPSRVTVTEVQCY